MEGNQPTFKTTTHLPQWIFIRILFLWKMPDGLILWPTVRKSLKYKIKPLAQCSVQWSANQLALLVSSNSRDSLYQKHFWKNTILLFSKPFFTCTCDKIKKYKPNYKQKRRILKCNPFLTQTILVQTLKLQSTCKGTNITLKLHWILGSIFTVFLFMFINHQHHQEFLKLFLQHIVLPTYCESLFTFDC